MKLTSLISSRDLSLVLLSSFGISLLLSLSQILSDPVINKDAIIYLQSAHFIQLGDWQTAGKLYNWLLYPILIAGTSSITSLSLENAAHLLNALCDATTCSLFVALVHTLGGSHRRVLWLAAVVILCFPKFNEYRNMIIRDHGYWAFYLLGCCAYFRLNQNFTWSSFAGFVVVWIFAGLFRIEGLVICFILLSLLLWTFRTKLISSASLNWRKSLILVFASLLILTVILIFYRQFPAQLGKLNEVFHYLLWGIKTEGYFSDSLEIARTYLNSLTAPTTHSESLSGLILCVTILTILINEVLGTIGLLYCMILAYGVYQMRWKLLPNNETPWAHPIFSNILILLAFIFNYYYLTGRYPMALALTILLCVPHIMNLTYESIQHQSNDLWIRRMRHLALGIFCLVTLDSLISTGASKLYLKEAGFWIQENIDTEQKLFSNHPHVTYYAGQSPEKAPIVYSDEQFTRMAQDGKLQQFDILAIELGRKESEFEVQLSELLQKTPEKEFSNKRGDRVLIYRP